MTEETGYLLSRNVLPVNEFRVLKFFSPVDMTEKTPFFRNITITELYRRMAVDA